MPSTLKNQNEQKTNETHTHAHDMYKETWKCLCLFGQQLDGMNALLFWGECGSVVCAIRQSRQGANVVGSKHLSRSD